MAKLRLLFALMLVNLGTWLAALAISGYYEPGMTMAAAPASQPVYVDAGQFINLLARQRFVAAEAPMATIPAKGKVERAAPKAAKTKPPVAERRPRQALAPVPWPLNLFGN